MHKLSDMFIQTVGRFAIDWPVEKKAERRQRMKDHRRRRRSCFQVAVRVYQIVIVHGLWLQLVDIYSSFGWCSHCCGLMLMQRHVCSLHSSGASSDPLWLVAELEMRGWDDTRAGQSDRWSQAKIVGFGLGSAEVSVSGAHGVTRPAVVPRRRAGCSFCLLSSIWLIVTFVWSTLKLNFL